MNFRLVILLLLFYSTWNRYILKNLYFNLNAFSDFSRLIIYNYHKLWGHWCIFSLIIEILRYVFKNKTTYLVRRISFSSFSFATSISSFTTSISSFFRTLDNSWINGIRALFCILVNGFWSVWFSIFFLFLDASLENEM